MLNQPSMAPCICIRQLIALAALALFSLGCANSQDCQLRQALRERPEASTVAAKAYRVGSPDVVKLTVPGRSELSGTYVVQANGCIDLGEMGGIRVEGLTATEAARHVGTLARVNPEAVRFEVVEYQSQHVYLAGEVNGLQRAVAYQGPETIVDLLRRTGGITEDGAPDEVRIVRNPMLAKSEPEVLRVDLRAVLTDKNPAANVIVQPYDQIFVPETKQARVGKCLHPWVRNLGKALGGAS